MARMKPPVSEWAADLRALRCRAGLTQVDLGVLIGLAPSTIYRAERGVIKDAEVRERIEKWMARARRAQQEAA